jgi:hypothetical protein
MKNIFITLSAMLICINVSAQGFSYEVVGNKNQNQNNTQNVAQNETNKNNTKTNTTTERKKIPMEFGGNIGLSFGDETHIVVSPTIGWQFSPYFAAGVGVNYIHHKYNDFFNYKENHLGASIYARTRLLDYIAIYARPELNYSWGSYENSGFRFDLEKKFIPSFIVGAGVYIPAGNGYMMISGYYDVVQNDRSPYGKNIGYSVGYTFSF